MPGAICKAAICSNNLAATATTLANRVDIDHFSDEQLEHIIETSEKAIEKLLEVATE